MEVLLEPTSVQKLMKIDLNKKTPVITRKSKLVQLHPPC